MQKTWILPVLLSSLVAPACSKGDGDSAVEIADLGVTVALPDGFEYQEKKGQHWLVKNSFYSAVLQKEDKMPSSLDDAIKSWLDGSVKDKGEVAGGGYYAVVDVEFPGDEKITVPYVNVIVPSKEGAISCSGQLQPKDDPSALLEACKGIKAL
jgi:hypothetical protein